MKNFYEWLFNEAPAAPPAPPAGGGAGSTTPPPSSSGGGLGGGLGGLGGGGGGLGGGGLGGGLGGPSGAPGGGGVGGKPKKEKFIDPVNIWEDLYEASKKMKDYPKLKWNYVSKAEKIEKKKIEKTGKISTNMARSLEI